MYTLNCIYIVMLNGSNGLKYLTLDPDAAYLKPKGVGRLFFSVFRYSVCLEVVARVPSLYMSVWIARRHIAALQTAFVPNLNLTSLQESLHRNPCDAWVYKYV